MSEDRQLVPHANQNEGNLTLLTKTRASTLSAGLALTLAASFGVPAANASDTATSNTSAAVTVNSAQAEQEFTDTLERLFTEAVILDSEGNLVSYDEAAAVDIVGAEEAGKLTAAVQQAQNTQQMRNSGMATAAESQSFVDCMVENSVLGLVGGIASGSYAELIREKKWDELGEKVWPKVAKAGVTGGAVGVAAGLAASSVQCTFFN